VLIQPYQSPKKASEVAKQTSGAIGLTFAEHEQPAWANVSLNPLGFDAGCQLNEEQL
jgi:hypothetical protein